MLRLGEKPVLRQFSGNAHRPYYVCIKKLCQEIKQKEYQSSKEMEVTPD